jgi:hypothetical protein
VGFVPVEFNAPDIAIGKFNMRYALQFSPPATAINLLQISQVTNLCSDSDNFNILDLANDFKFHDYSLARIRSRGKPFPLRWPFLSLVGVLSSFVQFALSSSDARVYTFNI